MNKIQSPQNLQLIISASIVIIVGLAYGVIPNTILPFLFNIEIHSIELQNIFRAMMGLYLAMGLFLILGAKYSKYWRVATLISVMFTAGLAVGRIISTLFDGFSPFFTLALVVELALMVWGIFNLKSQKYSNV